MAVTPADVKALGPELATIPDLTVGIYLDIASCLINAEAWGACGDKALKLMTAHLLTIGYLRGGAGAGPVSSESVAELSVSYGALNSATDINELGLTGYGMMLAQLRRARFVLPFIV